MEWMELKVHDEFVDAWLVCMSRPITQHFVAAAFGVVAKSATLLCNKLHSNVAQQKSGVSLLCGNDESIVSASIGRSRNHQSIAQCCRTCNYFCDNFSVSL